MGMFLISNNISLLVSLLYNQWINSIILVLLGGYCYTNFELIQEGSRYNSKSFVYFYKHLNIRSN